jgi:hypothetical protein
MVTSSMHIREEQAILQDSSCSFQGRREDERKERDEAGSNCRTPLDTWIETSRRIVILLEAP